MKYLVIFLMVMCSLYPFNRLFAQKHDTRYLDGALYFKVKSSFPDTLDLNSVYLQPLVALYHMDTCYRPFAGLNNDTLERTYRIRFSDTAKTQWCMDTLRSLPFIDYVEQVPLRQTSFLPDDFNGNQWGLIRILAQSAWDISKGSTGIVIAIVDNGVRLSHEDLAANLWVNTGEIPNNGIDDDFNGYVDDVNGYDVADNDGNPNPPAGISQTDVFNHGTHCAGIASAVTNNNKGIASIGYNTRIMAIKCISNSATNGGELTNTDDGITYAIRNHANIISMSFGSSTSSNTEQTLINTAYSRNIVLVAAAGNDNADTLFYPASYPGVICVGATDQNDHKASFSNYGSSIAVMAPGVSIYSTLASGDSDYGTFSGTSMACPLVAGLSALILAVNPSFTPEQVVTQLENTADDIDPINPNYTGQLGAGRINAFRAVGGVPSNVSSVAMDDENIQVYPNPFNDKIDIERISGNGPLAIEWLDMQGKVINRQTATGESLSEIETPGLAQGVYILKITSKDQSVCRKMMKF